MFDDGDNIEKSKTSIYIPWSLGLVPSLIVHDDRRGDKQEDYGKNASDDTSTVDDAEPIEQAPPPSAEILLRRSTRERQPSTRCPSHEYIILTDGEEPETYWEAILYE